MPASALHPADRLFKLVLLVLAVLLPAIAALPVAEAAGGAREKPAYPAEENNGVEQFAVRPFPLSMYKDVDPADGGLWATLKARAGRDPFNLIASIIFLCAIVHTFLAGVFIEMAHKHEKRHKEKIHREGRTAAAKPHRDARDDVSFRATLFHFLGEVEVIFGLWVVALVGAFLFSYGISLDGFVAGFSDVKHYIGYDVVFTEPLFVVVIMAIAASRPVVRLAEKILRFAARFGGGTPAAWWMSVLILAPLLGSFITEPAAMTIGALILAKKFYELEPSPKFAYATLGLLFVNVSVGGTLTHFAAPPVLMVAATWEWDTMFMLVHFGWKATLGILIATAGYFLIFRGEFKKLRSPKSMEADMNMPIYWHERDDPVPSWVTTVHVVFLAWTVLTNHYPALFIGGFLFFIAFSQATEHHQNEVELRNPLLVGFFLAGLVIHGGCQRWWIEPILTSDALGEWTLMLGSTLLTAFNDNAAITYLASQAPNIKEAAKYAVVAGAVAGGGLTVIANAPNPAGQAILKRFFPGGVSPLKLALGALLPTAVMIIALMI